MKESSIPPIFIANIIKITSGGFMSFIDEVKKVQTENYIPHVGIEVAFGNAYRSLIQEEVKKIKDQIIKIAKSDAEKGISCDCIKGKYTFPNYLSNVPIGKGYQKGDYKHFTVEESDSNFYIRFKRLTEHTCRIRFFNSEHSLVFTVLGENFFNDLQVACKNENIILETPRIFFKLCREQYKFPEIGIRMNNTFKTGSENVCHYNFISDFSFRL